MFFLNVVRLVACGNKGGLIAYVVDIGTREARGQGGQLVGYALDILMGLDRLEMNLEYLGASFDVRSIDHDMPVEATGPHKRRIQDVRPIRARQNNDVLTGSKTIHFYEELVES